MTRIIHIADLHFGAEEPSLVTAFETACEALDPDVIVAAGDFTQAGRKREFDAAAALFDRLDRPAVGAAGNHDAPVYALAERFMRPWRRFERRLGGAVRPSWSDDQTAIETFNTARRAQARLDWSLGVTHAGETEAAIDRLEAASAPVKLLACHHPLIAPGGSQGRANTRRGEETAARLSGVCDLVLTGHLHEAFILPSPRPDTTCWFIGAGTTFSWRVRGEPAGFNQIDIGPDGFEITHWRAVRRDAFAPDAPVRLSRGGS